MLNIYIYGNFCSIASNVKIYLGGNPSYIIKYRFTKEQIDKLLEIK